MRKDRLKRNGRRSRQTSCSYFPCRAFHKFVNQAIVRVLIEPTESALVEPLEPSSLLLLLLVEEIQVDVPPEAEAITEAKLVINLS